MGKSVLVTCHTCRNTFYKYPSLVRERNFCCDSCYRDYRKTLTGEKSHAWKGGVKTTKCQRCEKDFEQPTESYRAYCSADCRIAALRDAGKRRIHPRPSCKNCGATAKYAKTFCSYACFNTYRINNPRSLREETKAKISAANKGANGLSGKSNPMFRHGGASTTTKNCPECERLFVAPSHHVYCSRTCKGRAKRREFNNSEQGQMFLDRMSEKMAGDGNPNWRDGASVVLYARGFTLQLKRSIWERDDYTCQMCKKKLSSSRYIATHHRDGGKDNHSPENLITLCRPCHGKVHGLKITL